MEAFKAYYSRIVLVPQIQSPVEWVRPSHLLFFLMIIHCYPVIVAISCIYLSISPFPPIALIFTLEFSSAYSPPMWSGEHVAQWLGKRWVFDHNYCLTLLVVKGGSGNEEIGNIMLMLYLSFWTTAPETTKLSYELTQTGKVTPSFFLNPASMGENSFFHLQTKES